MRIPFVSYEQTIKQALIIIYSDYDLTYLEPVYLLSRRSLLTKYLCANFLFSKNQISIALEFVKQIYEEDKTYTDNVILFSKILRKQKKFSDSIEIIKEYINKIDDVQNYRIFSEFALASYSLKNYHSAIVNMKKSIDMRINKEIDIDAWSYVILASSLKNQKAYEFAIDLLKVNINNYINNVEYVGRLGLYLHATKNIEESLKYLKIAIKLNPPKWMKKSINKVLNSQNSTLE